MQTAIPAESHFEVGVVVVRRRLKGPWASHAWLPYAVLPEVPAAAPWTSLGQNGQDSEDELFFAGALEVALHPGATSHYRDNLALEVPSVWVALRPVAGGDVEAAAVTVDPYEGEAMAGGMDEIVDQVAMPAELRARLAAYVEVFHVERPFVKRQRDRADPEALARHRPHPAGRGGETDG